MKLTGKRNGTYYPTFMNNWNLPKNEQIWVRVSLKHPSQADRELLTIGIRYHYHQSENGTEITALEAYQKGASEGDRTAGDSVQALERALNVP